MANNVKELFAPVIFLVTYPSAGVHCPEQGLWSLSDVICLTIFPSPLPSQSFYKDPFPALKAVLSLLPLIPYHNFSQHGLSFSYLCPSLCPWNLQVSFMAQLTRHQPLEPSWFPRTGWEVFPCYPLLLSCSVLTACGAPVLGYRHHLLFWQTPQRANNLKALHPIPGPGLSAQQVSERLKDLKSKKRKWGDFWEGDRVGEA